MIGEEFCKDRVFLVYLHNIVIKRSFIVGVKSGKKINCERIIRIACMNNKPLVSFQRIDIYIYILREESIR